MKAVMAWAIISTVLMGIGLAIHALPGSKQGMALTLCLVATSAGLIWKISRG
jgi:hypothetical protein